MKKKTKIMIAAAAGAAVLLGGLWFFLNCASAGENAVYVQKISQLTVSPAALSRFSGVVEAQKSLDIKKDGAREVSEIYVSEGQTVAENTPLFRYDVRDAENQIATASLDIEGLNNQIAVYYGDNSTEAQLAVAGLQLEIRQKEADIARYQQEINQAEVRSSIAGVVKAVNANGGYDQSGAELPLISITETGEFRVRGKVSEQLIGTVSAGMSVVVRSRVDEKKTWPGQISVIETEPAQNNQNGYYYGDGEQSTSYPFYVSMENTEGLMLGQHVLIEPDYGQGTAKEGIWLYSDFIAFDDNGDPFVWASKNGKLEKRKIETGAVDPDTGEIEITAGLSTDDSIAWPDETLTEGMRVTEALQ